MGDSADDLWDKYLNNEHSIRQLKIGEKKEWGASLTNNLKKEIGDLRGSVPKYRHLDDSVLMAILTARKAVMLAGWDGSEDMGVNIGSSRGATGLFERYHSEFINSGSTPTLTSPTTTLGNISSWVAHDLKTKGPEISHSITCSTSLHAMLNAIAWIRSGMTSKFIVGGSEAPLTAFTIAQMKALNIYSKFKQQSDSIETEYPCRALDLAKKVNSMVLGEGASVACLELGVNSNSLAVIDGIGYATEPLVHNVSLSSDAACLQNSMSMALKGLDPKEVEVVVMHAPGTVKGDASEYKAIKKVFGQNMPALTSNKWKIGHCFGASGMLSIELAVLMLRQQEFVGVPYLNNKLKPGEINRVLVNAVGFGGNAVSILLSRADI